MSQEPKRSFGEMTSLHVRRAVAGDTESVDWIVVRFSPLLIAQANYRLGPHLRSIVEAEDLVNDMWLTVLPRLSTLEVAQGSHTAVLLKYLSRTLLFRINNLARKQLRRERGRGGGGDPDSPEAVDPVGQLSAEITGAVTRAIRAERQSAVAAAIEDLPESDREIVILRGIEQQSNAVVAALLDVTPEAAAMRYHRALKKLREKLPRSVFDEFDDGDEIEHEHELDDSPPA